ncbi:MAG TPA: DUF5069 domain-containing protein, partial [Trinickia sp.]|nr:DUF5069 domain-containing protein [Trinickia sp.]
LDLRTGVPRSGKEMIAGFAWLGRAADKARAKIAGMIGDYIFLCPVDKGFLALTRVTEDEFIELIARGSSDEEVGSYFERHVPPVQRDSANRWILEDMRDELDAIDREERRAA